MYSGMVDTLGTKVISNFFSIAFLLLAIPVQSGQPGSLSRACGNAAAAFERNLQE